MRNMALLLALLAGLFSAASPAAPLWQLEGGRSTIYLLGSVHFLRAGDYPLPETVQAAYAAAEVLVMELDMDDLNPIQAQATLSRMAVDPQGRDLEQLVGERDFATARERATGIGIDLETLRPFEPWYAALQISQLRLVQLGLDPQQGIEARLLARAQADGKRIVGLETFESQLRTLDSLPPRDQARFLLVTLEDAEEIPAHLETLLQAWRRGDVATLERELLASLREQPALYARLLVDRNRNWTAQLQRLAERGGSYLVIVGALHLVGDDSVLAMLQRRGYPSRQLRD